MRSTHTNIINVLAKGESQGKKEVNGDETTIYKFYDYSSLLAQYESEQNEEKEVYVPKIAEAAMQFKRLIASCLYNVDKEEALRLNNAIDQGLVRAYQCSRMELEQFLPELNCIINNAKEVMLAQLKEAGKQSAEDLSKIKECAEVISSHLFIELNKLDAVIFDKAFNTSQSPNFSDAEKPVELEKILAEYSVPLLSNRVAELLKPYPSDHAKRKKYEAKKQNQLNQAYQTVNRMMETMMKEAQNQQAKKEKESDQASHRTHRRHK